MYNNTKKRNNGLSWSSLDISTKILIIVLLVLFIGFLIFNKFFL